MPRRPELITHLPESLRRGYGRIPKEDRKRFEDELHKIKRWGEGRSAEEYGDISYLPKPPRFSESNLQHTIGMIEMADTLSQYPRIGSNVNWDDVRVMAIVHDAGEIRIGDVPPNGSVRESKRWRLRKSYEEVAVYGILAEISDPKISAYVTSLYDRYMRRDPADVEAAIANFFDKAQGTLLTGPLIFNNFRLFGEEEPSEPLRIHVTTNLATVYDKAERVLKSPLGIPSCLDFRDYLHMLYNNLDQQAYATILKMNRARLDVAFLSSVSKKTR